MMRTAIFLLMLMVPLLAFAQPTEVTLHPTQMGLFGASAGSFFRAGASGGQWESSSSLQGTLLLPSGTQNHTLRYNGSAWVSSGTLSNDGNFVGIGTTSPSVLLDLRRPGNDGFISLTGYDTKIKVGGTPSGGSATLSAQFVLESENASLRETITEIVPSSRSTALYRYYGAEITNTFSGVDGVIRTEPGANPFFQRMWNSGNEFNIGYINKTNGQTFSAGDFVFLSTINRAGLYTVTNTKLTGQSGTGNRIAYFDANGNILRGTEDPSGVATNIYNTDGTLTANRNLSCGTSRTLTIDASGWTTSPAQPLIIKGKETSFTTRFLEYQNESATWRFRGTASAGLVSLSTNSLPLEMIGSTYVRNTAGSVSLEVNSGGYYALTQATSDPGSPANSSFWANNTENRMKVRFSSATKQVATLEDDIIGNAVATKTANFTLQAQDLYLILDANGGSFTATLDGTMREGITYMFECRRNGTNTITLDAGAGYNLAFPGISSFPDDGAVACGGAGTGDQAAHRNYAIRRMGTNILVW